jgi:hypothetical protein
MVLRDKGTKPRPVEGTHFYQIKTPACYGSPLGMPEAEDAFKKGRFARPVWTQDGSNLTGFRLQGSTVQYPFSPVLMAEMQI